MITCGEIANKLQRIQTQNNPVLISLSHYFQYFLNPKSSFEPRHIESYFRRLYGFEYWRKEVKTLQEQVKIILSKILEKEDLRKLSTNLFFQSPQFVSLEYRRDLQPIIDTYAKTKKLDYKLIDGEDGYHYIHYKWPNGKQAIQKIYPNMYVAKGVLKPITTDEILYFDTNYELLNFQPQFLHLGDYVFARFEKTANGFRVRSFKGYSLQNNGQQEIERLEQYSSLYYSVKKMESLLTGKKDNSMYQKLTELLEKALDLLKSQHPEGVKLAFIALERGKNACQTTFPNDKLLQVLIKELTFHLEKSLEGNVRHADTPK